MKQEKLEQSQWEKKLEVENEGFKNHCTKFKLMIYYDGKPEKDFEQSGII